MQQLHAVEALKLKACKFIFEKLKSIKEKPNAAHQIERPVKGKKGITYWKMPNIYGEDCVVTSQVLPMGFQFNGKERNPIRY